MKSCGLLLVFLAGFLSPVFADTWIVNSTRDAPDAVLDGVCATLALPDEPPVCTLRAALQEAHHDTRFRVGHHIEIPIGVYRLTYSEADPADEENGQILGTWSIDRALRTGDLDIAKSLWITGDGAGVTIIDGNGRDRVLDFWPNDVRDTTMQNLTLRNGSTATQGGCIFNRGFHTGLWMYHIHIEGCRAGTVGGGIANEGALTMGQSVFRQNRALRGGGLYNGFIAHITETTFDDNTAEPGFGLEGMGGAIANFSNVGFTPGLRLNNSTLSNNHADVAGALLNHGYASLANSTVSGNRARRSSAIAHLPPIGMGEESSLSIGFSTIAGNVATQSGWAAVTNPTGQPLSMHAVIVAQNRAGLSTVNCDGPVTWSSDSIEDANTCGLSGDGDQPNTDPLIGTLAANGGLTLTHALLDGSPAIDAAHPPNENRDQRGFPRPMFGGPDIGAYEKGFEITLLIPIDWSTIAWIFTRTDTSYRVDLSLVTMGKSSPDLLDARVIGAKAANGQAKFDVSKDGKSMTVSGVFTPPKDQGNSTLFYLEVLPAVEKVSQLQLSNAACDCDVKMRKNPPTIVISSAEKLAKQ